MFENPRRSSQARNFRTNVPKILDLKSTSEQIFFRKLSLGAPESNQNESTMVKTDQVIDRSVRRDDLLKLSGTVHREKFPYFK